MEKRNHLKYMSFYIVSEPIKQIDVFCFHIKDRICLFETFLGYFSGWLVGLGRGCIYKSHADLRF